jgi:2-iminoacetate synthase
MLTLAEYIVDYATPETAAKGWKVIDRNLESLGDERYIKEVNARIERIKQGERDLYF